MRIHRFFLLTATMACLGALGACGDSSSNGPTDAGGGSSAQGGTTAQGGNAAQGGGGGSQACTISCEAPKPAHPGTKPSVGLVTARVLDLNGNGASQILADVCGTNKCLSAETDADGNASKDAAGDILDDVAFIYGNGKRFAKMAARLQTFPNTTFGEIHTISLPDFSAGVAMLPGQVAAQGGVSLDVPDGACVKHDRIIYTDASEQVFRAATTLVSAGSFPAVDASLNIEVLIATAPINTRICAGAAMTFANEAGWDAAAEVLIYLHGTNTFDHYAPYGGWSKVAEAVVSADGKTITTKDGEGIEMLGVFGASLK